MKNSDDILQNSLAKVTHTDNKIQTFEDKKIRTAWNEETEEWYFFVVDVVSILTDSKDPTAYWRKLKQRLKAEGNERALPQSSEKSLIETCPSIFNQINN